MATSVKTPRMLGQPIKRREDPRLITGAGQFLDDISMPGLLHMAVVRSPYGHAHVNGIDATAALAVPGIVAIVTANDVEGELKTPMPYEFGWQPFENVNDFARGALATDKVRYVGDPVAVVVGEDRYKVRDAAALVVLRQLLQRARLRSRWPSRPTARRLK